MYEIRPGWLVNPGRIRGVRWTIHQVSADDRGSFTEAACDSILQMVSGHHIRQVNVSISKPRVLRAMHVHAKQTDFWYIAKGIAEVAVQSPDMVSETKVLYPGHGVIIPPKVGHGFLALDDLILIYAVSQEFDHENPDEYEYQAHFVNWSLPLIDTIRSERDLNAGTAWPVVGLRHFTT